MPQRRQRAAIYVRESDVSLAMDSTTIESAIKALLDHCQKEGYDVDPTHIFKEAISGYFVYYFDRPELMKMLKAAERHEFDVLVVTEIRALSRKGAGEVLVIYSSLQKANVKLETLSDKFNDNDPMSEVLLSFRASWARIEREQSFLRMQRGKKDRIEIGNAPPNGRRCYGYILVDTEKETKGRYEFNTATIYTDPHGIAWSEIKVREYILESVLDGKSLHKIAIQLNEWGVPPPRKPIKGIPCWDATAVRRIAQSPINIGEVWVNQRKRVGKVMVQRPREEWILLEGIAPALIDREMYEEILKQIAWNKQDALRNNQHAHELGLLRAGYIFCGVCNRRMTVKYASKAKSKGGPKPLYNCYHKEGEGLDIQFNHRTAIRVRSMDLIVKNKIREALLEPEIVRAKVAKIRKANKPIVDEQEIAETIAAIQKKMKNIYTLAENATDDETIVGLTERMQALEKEKREAQAMLYVLEDDAEERSKVEEELQRFEAWVGRVQPFLTDPVYLQTASYAELRAAIRVLGIRVTVYPTIGDWPYRHQVDVTAPQILANIMGQSSL